MESSQLLEWWCLAGLLYGALTTAHTLQKRSCPAYCEPLPDSPNDCLCDPCSWDCWGAFGEYGDCSVQCGSSGVRWQHRQVDAPAECSDFVHKYGCPGSSSRSRSCNRFCRNGGTLLPSSCLCPAAYTGVCCESRVTCGDPGRPEHGEVTPGGDHHYYGATVVYHCYDGYQLQGGSSSRRCLENGLWGGATPICQVVDCGDPGVPENSERRGDLFTYREVVIFVCHAGFNLTGDSLRQCQVDGTWSGHQPNCQQIVCVLLEGPSEGRVQMPGGPFYNQTATYSCRQGFHLVGPEHRYCQQDGSWSGQDPSCDVIECVSPESPAHGGVEVSSSRPAGIIRYGDMATFSCDPGYTLKGARVRACEGQGPVGAWNGDPPSCHAVVCPEPTPIAHGLSEVRGQAFPTGGVTYICLPGYYLNGTSVVSCSAEGNWTHPPPSCQPCEFGEYKPDTSAAVSCLQCGVNSHTTSTASTSGLHCTCDTGYVGPAGGPCSAVQCDWMDVPENGRLVPCNQTVGQRCEVDCLPGYIQISGDTQRECGLDGHWSGSPLVCQACGVDTYASSATTCSRCPENTHTQGEGHLLSGCLCDDGFRESSEGVCQDVNECSLDNGGCEQMCRNIPGSYQCICHLPGYIIDASHPTRCAPRNACPELEPVLNGGFVCVAETTTNTERCQVKCNYGYDHVVRPNLYEECGPSTNWQWSSDLSDIPLLPCQESFFTGIQMEAEVFCFAESCEILTSAQLEAIKLEFLEFLTTTRGVCRSETGPACDVEDVSVKCSDLEGHRQTLTGRGHPALQTKCPQSG